MSQENVPGEAISGWRKFLWGPWERWTLIASLIGLGVFNAVLSLTVFDTGWAGVRSGTIALIVLGGLCVLWNENRRGTL